MAIKCEEYNNVCVMNISGDLSGDEPAALRLAIEQRIETKQIADFVLNFEKTGFVDSEGLETLLWIKRKCEDLFGQVKLSGLDESCRKILEITRLTQRFECHSDLTTALKMMR